MSCPVLSLTFSKYLLKFAHGKFLSTESDMGQIATTKVTTATIEWRIVGNSRKANLVTSPLLASNDVRNSLRLNDEHRPKDATTIEVVEVSIGGLLENGESEESVAYFCDFLRMLAIFRFNYGLPPEPLTMPKLLLRSTQRGLEAICTDTGILFDAHHCRTHKGADDIIRILKSEKGQLLALQVLDAAPSPEHPKAIELLRER